MKNLAVLPATFNNAAVKSDDTGRDPAGFTGLAVLKDGRIIVDDIVPAEAWAYFCEHILLKDADTKAIGVGLAGIFARGVFAYQQEAIESEIVRKNEERRGYVYFMRDTRNGYIKIGVSRSPDERETTLQSEQPAIGLLDRIELKRKAHSFKVEAELHEAFAAYRRRGEWFELSTSQMLDAIQMAETSAQRYNEG